MYTLYTTYLSNVKNIPANTSKAIIMRFIPKGFSNNPEYIHILPLSPEANILKKYKADDDFDSFTKSYLKQIEEDLDAREWLDKIARALKFNNVAIICCEKDGNCHRHIIGDLFRKEDIEVKEV